MLGFRALLVVGAVACGGPSLPPPPPYTPSGTPEPETACPKDRDAAKAAREAVLAQEGSTAQAAAAIFRHAECERAQVDAMPIESADADLFRLSVRALKSQVYTVRNLYEEALAQDPEAWGVGCWVGLGDLYAAYAAKLRGTPPGPGFNDASGQAEWHAEVDELARPVDVDAASAYVRALEGAAASARPPESPGASWVARACAGLGKVDPAGPSRYPACHR